MFEINIYRDERGRSDIEEYILELREKSINNKEARINLHKIVSYIDVLKEMGTRAGEPITKHLDGEIWELRPLSNRIFYAYYKDNTFVLLHHFKKKTQKTPRREIEKAKREYKDFAEQWKNSD